MQQILFDNEYRKIGAKILYYRKLNQMTQKELAQKTNLSPAQISKIEYGKGNYCISSIFIIAKTLNIKYSTLFENLKGSD